MTLRPARHAWWPNWRRAAYSPDLNPIENAYSKLKTLLRKGSARTVEALIKLFGRSITAFTKEDCRGYFSHAGYQN
jgi:transposase